MNKTEVIKNFLINNTHNDLSSLYKYTMEIQIQVAQENGVTITGEYLGKNWQGWENPTTGEVWKNFRIPWNANKDPDYTDSEMTFNFEKYVQGIGMTGWDWFSKLSKWVAFDFDAITGHSERHSKKLSNDELLNIENVVSSVPWVTVRRSTSGNGLHLYVFLDNDITTNNHCEHQALARYILGKLAGETGLDLDAKVDARGNIMWVWHRKMLNTNGLTLIKNGVPLAVTDERWKEHIPVVEGKRKRILPAFIAEQNLEEVFNESCSQQSIIPLDSEHKRLILWLSENNYYANWSIDQKILITHTNHLKDAYNTLKLIGIYDTLASGESGKADYNCYALPLRKGGWVIRRYSPGVAETDNWFQDSSGWTTTYYNRIPTFSVACKSNGGLENKKGAYVFNDGLAAAAAAKAMGISISIPEKVIYRQHTLSLTKRNKLVVEFNKDNTIDSPKELGGWIQESKTWAKVYDGTITNNSEIETPNFDELIRHLVTETGLDSGWRIKSDNVWCDETIAHVKAVLAVFGLSGLEAQSALGGAIMKKWTVVNRPFEPEFLENRRWNLNAAQLRFAPSLVDNPHFPHWQMIFDHCGKNLTDAVLEHQWCQQNNIIDGSTYLKLWVASLIQESSKHLPYVFFYGEQNVGKSTFYEALCLLITEDGIKEANTALLSQGNFNGELSKAVLCYVEEIDLTAKGNGAFALNKIKNWVMNDYLTIHAKGFDPYTIPNSTHWIHTSNHITYCPIFPGDERIVVVKIDPPENLIPKGQFKEHLRKEAPDFLNHLLKIQLPPTNERLNLPVIKTFEKTVAEQANMTFVEKFINEHLYYYPSKTIRFSEFSELFKEYLNKTEPNEMAYWNKTKIRAAIPSKYLGGTSTKDGNHVHLINISKDQPSDEALKMTPLTSKNGRIVWN